MPRSGPAPPNSRADATGFFAHGRRGKAMMKAGPRKQARLMQLQGAPWTVIMVTLKAEPDAVLEVDADVGKASIAVASVAFDKPTILLGGTLLARRLPAATPLVVAPTDNDYPAAARGPDGAVWVAFVAYRHGGEPDMEAAARGDFRSLVPHGNGDQIRLCRCDGRQWSAAMPVTEGLADLWKPTVAVDGAGKVWVAWSQNVAGNWDIYRRSYDPAAAAWTAIERVTTAPGADVNVVTHDRFDGQGLVGLAGAAGEFFQIFLVNSDAGAQPIAVTDNPANHWDPAIAADSKGNVFVAWDGYGNKNYDVFLRQFKQGRPEPIVPVATTSDLREPRQPGRRSPGSRVDRLRAGRAELGKGFRQDGAGLRARGQQGQTPRSERPCTTRAAAGRRRGRRRGNSAL